MGARQGKFRRLVDDFQATLDQLGGRMPPEVVEQLLTERIAAVAAALGVTEAAALRTYFDEDWGSESARRAWADRLDQDAARAQTAPGWVPVDLVARLIAALGQAQLFAAVNTDSVAPGSAPAAAYSGAASTDRGRTSDGGLPAREASLIAPLLSSTHTRGFAGYTPVTAAQATSGLGQALYRRGPEDRLDDGQVWVGGEVLAQTRDSLAGFAQQLRQRRWSPCPCGEDHGQDEITDAVLAAVLGDLAELREVLDTPGDDTDDGLLPGGGEDAVAVLTEALGHELPEWGRDAPERAAAPTNPSPAAPGWSSQWRQSAEPTRSEGPRV